MDTISIQMYTTYIKPANKLHGKQRVEFNHTEKTAQFVKNIDEEIT